MCLRTKNLEYQTIHNVFVSNIWYPQTIECTVINIVPLIFFALGQFIKFFLVKYFNFDHLSKFYPIKILCHMVYSHIMVYNNKHTNFCMGVPDSLSILPTTESRLCILARKVLQSRHLPKYTINAYILYVYNEHNILYV